MENFKRFKYSHCIGLGLLPDKKDKTLHASFPVIHKVGNVDIFLCCLNLGQLDGPTPWTGHTRGSAECNAKFF